MGKLLYIGLILMMIYLFYKNITLIKRNKHLKAYSACFGAILEEKEEALTVISDYIAKENAEEFKNKGRILKAYVELASDKDPCTTLEALELRDLIMTKERIDIPKMQLNSDSFYWLTLAMLLATIKENQDAVDLIDQAIKKYNDAINGDLIIALYEAIEAALKGEEKGLDFLKALLNGDYGIYRYDKRMIGLYKYLALSVLAYLKQELTADERDDLVTFSQYKAGKLLLKALKLDSEYAKTDEQEENA